MKIRIQKLTSILCIIAMVFLHTDAFAEIILMPNFSYTISNGEAIVGEKDGFTAEQRFFLAYANVWAGNIRAEEVLQRTKSDPHSLGMWRVNGALPHINAWYEAWNVTPESPLYLEPQKRVSIW